MTASPEDPADAALAAALLRSPEDAARTFDLDGLAVETGAPLALLEAIARTGLLVPHHHDASGGARFTSGDADAVRAGLTLLEEGLPLGELLTLAERADAAVSGLADDAVEAFVRFVRDATLGDAPDPEDVASRLVGAYERMLPATTFIVAHHLRRRLLEAALRRLEAATPDGAP